MLDPEEKEAILARIGRDLAEYEVVRSLPEHPGWKVLVEVLQRKAREQREAVQTDLDTILDRGRTPEREESYQQNRVWLLGYEIAIQIWLRMREAAATAVEEKNSLDKMSADALDFNP